jgi:hypothetical protein
MSPKSLPSIPQARKMLLDYMDSRRPWASSTDVYAMMEDIANYAALAFRNEHTPTKEEVSDLHRDLLRFTGKLNAHPVGYEGPCACLECRESS